MFPRSIGFIASVCAMTALCGCAPAISWDKINARWKGHDVGEVTGHLGNPNQVIEPIGERTETIYRYDFKSMDIHGGVPQTAITSSGGTFGTTTVPGPISTTVTECIADFWFDPQWKVEKVVGSGINCD